MATTTVQSLTNLGNVTNGVTVVGEAVAGTTGKFTLATTGSGSIALATSPRITTSILDANGNTMLGFVPTTTSVNYFQFTNAATAGSPTLDITGSDSNINAKYVCKGTGTHIFQSTSNTCMQFRSGTTAQHTTNFIFINSAATKSVTFPDADGTVTLLGNTSTGSGSVVLATSPTLVTPLLGTPTSGVLTNCTGLPVATGISGLGTGVATFLATPSSANLATAVTDETGTGALVFGTSPRITTSILDTNGNTVIGLTATGSAVNYFQLANAAAGGSPSITAIGTNTNIGINLVCKGSGQGSITSTNNTPFAIASGTSSQHITAFTFANTANTRVVTFPDADGTVTLLGNTSTGSGSVVLATSPTITTPTIDSIKDSNGNTILTLTPTAAAVNGIEITNAAAAGIYPRIKALGSDSNIGFNFVAKGTGVIQYQSTSSTPFQIISGSLVHTTNLSFANTNVTRTITFPDVDGTATLLGNTSTGSGSVVLATSPTLVTPVLGAASATSISFSSTSGVIGSTTNDSAAAGSVGETITATGSAVAITTNTQTNVTSISLTAGDWLVYGVVKSNPAAGTTITEVAGGISTTTATLPTIYAATGTAAAAIATGPAVAPVRISISGTTTVYLVARIQYAVSTCTVSGTISGVRMR